MTQAMLEFTLKDRRLSVEVTGGGEGPAASAEVALDDPAAVDLMLGHIGNVEVFACVCNFRAAHWVRPLGALVPQIVAAAREAVGRG